MVQDGTQDEAGDQQGGDRIGRGDEESVRNHQAACASRRSASRMVSVRTRRRRISVRMPDRCRAIPTSVKASAITRSGTSMEAWMVGPPRRNTEAGWCRVFHQSTENLTIGTL